MDLPFDGGISRYFKESAPADVRAAVEDGGKEDILNPDFPYDTRWDRDEYENALEALQLELVRMLAWVRETGQRVAIVWPKSGQRVAAMWPTCGQRVAKVWPT